MPKKIDWLYDRRSCTTCKKAQSYLGQVSIPVTETVDAAKVRFNSAEALRLLDGIDTFIAMKGVRVVRFDLKNERPGDEVLLAHLMGPTGNLRAPTARVGKTLMVGFNEATYREQLG
jgi:arsenate reductase-like glutaredoxin family protein